MKTMQETEVAVIEGRYVPSRLVPGLGASTALAALGVATALAGVTMGWILAVFMFWSVGNALTKMRRRDPVLTLDASGATDHRIPLHVAWEDVASMRTVDRRVVFTKVPLLELVPTAAAERDPKAMIGAVFRGDIAFADARNRDRVMIDLRFLDVTPEEVLAAARALRA